MALATTKCLQYVVVGRRRQPERQPEPGTYPAGLGPIPCYTQRPPNDLVTGSPYYVDYPDEGFECEAEPELQFAFQSVTGLTEGGMVSFDRNNPCHGIVGTSPITVTNVYIPRNGNGEGHAAIIDAFDMEAGCFSNDDFVTVSPDDDGSLTESGNVLGVVDTVQEETITAFDFIDSYSLMFKQWGLIAGAASNVTISGKQLIVKRNKSCYAFAFYQTRGEFIPKDPREYFAQKQFARDMFPPIGTLGDPYYWDMIKYLTDRITTLETQVKKQTGQAFIKAQERNVAGKNVTSKGTKRK